MSVILRSCHSGVSRPLRGPLRGLGLVTACAAMALAGCSADISRFDSKNFSLGDNGGGSTASTSGRRMAGGPVLDAPADRSPAPASTYMPPPSRVGSGIEIASLPAVEAPVAASAAVGAAPVRAMAVTRQRAVATAPQPTGKGEQIEVQTGDTLYAIARRHNVMISELMSVNDLKNPNLKPGQRLYLPAHARNRASPPKVNPQAKAERTAAAPARETPAAATTTETYTVKQGDSLYAIAAKNRIKLAELQRVNGITDAGKVKPGTVLKIPAAQAQTASAAAEPTAAAPVAKAAASAPSQQPEAAKADPSAPTAAAPNGVKVINGQPAQPPRQIAAAAPSTATDAGSATSPPATAAGGTGKLRWPVKGRIVQAFGPRADGSHNDGLDISVPAGTDVLAAENGVVAYAGNEVKTYGNLVLVRHDNGWITAYANNEKILVQRGDKVKRGQPIAKAGKTGVADQPQLHFEVRVGSKPVDPTGYLEKM